MELALFHLYKKTKQQNNMSLLVTSFFPDGVQVWMKWITLEAHQVLLKNNSVNCTL